MRRITLILVILIAALQWPLWFGKGNWTQVVQVNRALDAQRAINDALLVRNNALRAEVDDLKQGTSAIEERARNELGMIKPGEVFFQVLTPVVPSNAPRAL